VGIGRPRPESTHDEPASLVAPAQGKALLLRYRNPARRLFGRVAVVCSAAPLRPV